MEPFPSWTNCCAPSDHSGVPVWAMALLGTIGLGALIAGGVGGALAPGVAALLAMVCLAAIAFCSWWLNTRLICLGGDRSAVGAIYHLEPPSPSYDAFALGDYDTDYSFNLLLWQFTPGQELPASFTGEQWSPTAVSDLEAAWPALTGVPPVPFAAVEKEVDLIVAQQSMASLGLGFVGQDVNAPDTPDSGQHFLIHCEIEGSGIHDLRTFLWVLFGIYVAAAAVYLIPVVGPILSWIIALLALLAFLIGGPIIQHNDASPPSDGGWGGSFNPFDAAGDPTGTVDLAYAFGRWVYDSLHDGWNELHPLHFLIKIGQTTQGDIAAGNWPGDLGDKQGRLDAQFAANAGSAAAALQAAPDNQWTVHPLLDGCLGPTGYPEPDPGELIR